ncbi:hypothetical protein GCM10011381_14820 [Klenkia taihuensis]|nr:hypothetical protein GCM10011381_14820 [Klenkia taihuensis]
MSQEAPGAGARKGTASTHTRSPGPATGRAGAFVGAFRAAAVRAVVRAVVGLALRVVLRRPGTASDATCRRAGGGSGGERADPAVRAGGGEHGRQAGGRVDDAGGGRCVGDVQQ